MDHSLSRSEQKRRAKGLEDLVHELVELTAADIKRLPCDALLKEEILSTAAMQAGARKRQIKYLAKQLRQEVDAEPLFTFLEERKGSQLKQNKAFHDLERLRDAIISEALAAAREAESEANRLDTDWPAEAIAAAAVQYPSLDQAAAKSAALRYARTHKPAYSREIFRLLQTAMQQQRYRGQG